MRILLFLVLGTLLFGLAFPAFILFVGFLLFVFLVIAMIGFLTGIFGNRNVIIYKNGRRVDTFGGKKEEHTPDNPEVIVDKRRNKTDGSGGFDEDAGSEIIELPASALSKDDAEED